MKRVQYLSFDDLFMEEQGIGGRFVIRLGASKVCCQHIVFFTNYLFLYDNL